jgi:formate dehydrogenase major subunit
MICNRQADYGTPAPSSKQTVHLEIDGQPVSAPQGTSILRAARKAGIPIPSLCATDSVKGFGSCRLCLVEIEGRKGTPSSCTTPIADGLKVTTRSPRLARLRRGIMELYISDHPLECLTCAASGNCELQDMAGEVGLRQVRYGFAGENHIHEARDLSNPYFAFNPAKCIVCQRCVRVCNEVQGSFALTAMGRGFGARIRPGPSDFFNSSCVSCGACVAACPTASLIEKTVIMQGRPDRFVKTTCAYCGVGCSFVAELKGNQLIRMVPDKQGKANHGHSCIKGRFAWGYATHKDRITAPMIRENITDPWQRVSWDEAIAFTAGKFKTIQKQYGRKALGGITSSRCTNEEVWAVQKLIRAAFGNNNVDTCARVCHAPTGYGLKTCLGTSAGTQDFDSVQDADLILLIGANPTEAHPVFGAQIKQALRNGARLIVIDPRATELVKAPHIRADYHLALRPGANVAIINAISHVIVTEGLADEDYVNERCDLESYREWRDFMAGPEHAPENIAQPSGVAAADIRAAARAYAKAPNAAIYYGLGVTEHAQGSTMVMGLANLAMATGNLGRSGVGVNPMRGQNNVQGSCDMGSFPHELPGYRAVQDDDVRHSFEQDWSVTLDDEPGYRIPNMFDAALAGKFKGFYIQGEDIAQSDPNIQHVEAALRAMDCIVVQDLFLNETSRFAHVFLPGTTFLEKDGTFTNAERRMNRVRPAIKPRTGKHEWEVTQDLATAMGYPMNYENSGQIMDEIARLTPAFAHVSFALLDEKHSVQWPCNEAAPEGTPLMHETGFVRGKGLFVTTPYVPTDERTNRKFPLILTTGRILEHYNVSAQTRRTPNMKWVDSDVLEIHASDAEARGIRDNDLVALRSRMGETTLQARISSRMQPGIVFTSFHFPRSGTNMVTTSISDWATSCPEYKVTAVEVSPANHRSDWQQAREEAARNKSRIAPQD